MLDWTALILLCLAGAVAWFWQDSLAAREVANAAANEACERLALQFLDGTVAFARIRLGRAFGGRLVLRRTYVFDYTANSIERRQGFIVVTARQVETIGYAQDEARRERRLPVQPSREDEPARIVRLDDFRERPAQEPARTQRDEKSAVRSPPADDRVP